MNHNLANPFLLAAEAFCYPAPGLLEALLSGLAGLPAKPETNGIERFLAQVRGLSLSEWEELYTRTFDLNPPSAPYIGFHMWGESYQRGNFMALMNRALMENEIEMEGELPDHVIPVLRYLGRVDQPLPELREVLQPGFERIRTGLHKADPENPYLLLFDSLQELYSGLVKETA